MEYARNVLYDGFTNAIRGVDSGVAPVSLGENQLAWMVNGTVRGGFPETRPGFIKRTLRFVDSSGEFDSDLWTAFETGLFQGAAHYDGAPGESYLMVMVGGRLYRIRPQHDFRVSDLTPTQANSSILMQSWFVQAEEFMRINDGQSKTIIFDGSTSRRSLDSEIPVGTAGAYAHGRIWNALPNGFAFVAGDLVYGSSGTEYYGYRDAVNKFTENDYLNERGAFGIPSNTGGIRAIIPTDNLDTSLGQGPVLVMSPNLIASAQAPLDRTVWKNLEYPIQTVALSGYGPLGARCVVKVNGDIFYRAEDGLRSFTLSRAEFATWRNTPVSSEVNRVLQRDSRNLLEYCSVVMFDNRLLSTVSPYQVQGHGVAHRGLAVLDFDVFSRMFGAQPPAWEGIWTGLNVLQLVTGRFGAEERCFAFVLNGMEQIELWEVSRDAPHDYGDSGDSRISWSIESRAFDFRDRFGLKTLKYGQLWVDEMRGDVHCRAHYRTDAHSGWEAWHESGWTEEVDESMDEPTTTTVPEETNNEGRAKMGLPEPEDTASVMEDRKLREFFTFQARLSFTGRCRLKEFRATASVVDELPVGEFRT